MRNIYARNTWGVPLSRGGEAVYNADNDFIWKYETDWTRSASSDMRTFPPDVRMWRL